jgi:hypothetical protein
MTAATSSSRPDVDDSPAARLRRLACRIERLAVSGRLDPETIAVEKQQIVRAIRRLAMELQA